MAWIRQIGQWCGRALAGVTRPDASALHCVRLEGEEASAGALRLHRAGFEAMAQAQRAAQAGLLASLEPIEARVLAHAQRVAVASVRDLEAAIKTRPRLVALAVGRLMHAGLLRAWWSGGELLVAAAEHDEAGSEWLVEHGGRHAPIVRGYD